MINICFLSAFKDSFKVEMHKREKEALEKKCRQLEQSLEDLNPRKKPRSDHDYSISPTSSNQTLHLLIKNGKNSGRKIDLSVESTDTVRDLMKLIKTKEGTPVKMQRLIWFNKLLVPEATISDHGISDGDFIQVFVRS